MSRKMITSLVLSGSLAVFAGCKSNNTQPVAEVPPPQQPITAAHDPLLAPTGPTTAKGAPAKGQPAPAGSDSFTLGPGAPVYGNTPALTPPPAGPVSKGTAGAGTYTVRQGDTLWSIAKNHLGNGSRWREISNANNGLKPEQLKVGSAIVLP